MKSNVPTLRLLPGVIGRKIDLGSLLVLSSREKGRCWWCLIPSLLLPPPHTVQASCFDDVLQERSHSLNNSPMLKNCHTREERQKIRYANEKNFKNEEQHKALGHLNHLTPLNISWLLEILDSSLSNHQKQLYVHLPCTKNALMFQLHTCLHFIYTLHLALPCGYFADSLQSTHIVPARLYPYEQILHHVVLKKVLAPLVLNGTHNTCILHP